MMILPFAVQGLRCKVKGSFHVLKIRFMDYDSQVPFQLLVFVQVKMNEKT